MAEAWRSIIKSCGKFPPARDLCLINSQFLLQSRYQVDVSADASLRIPSRVVMVIWSLMRSSALQQLIRMYAAGFYSDWQSISALFQADCFVRGLTLKVK